MKESIDSTRQKYSLDFSKIHKIIRPADVRETDRIEARIRLRDNKDYIHARVWKMSPLGIELVQPVEGPPLTKGDPLDLELLVAGQRLKFEGLIVDLAKANDSISLAGVRFNKPHLELSDKSERRNVERWMCSPDYHPTAVCPTPGHIRDHMFFKIADISSEGLQLTCSLRNKMPVPGLILSLTSNFGVDGTFNTPVQIVRVGFTTEGGKDRLSVGVKFLKLTDRMKSIMGQYLVQFSNVQSIDDLRTQGFWPASIANAVNFSYLTTEAEYAEVLKLRKRAHDADKNLNEDVSEEDMGDMHDTSCRIIIGSHNGKLVCTARVRFNSPEEPLEHEAFVTWPTELPQRNEIIEIGRLALDPEYRHGDLLQGLFEYMAATCVHDRSYVVMSCLAKMVKFFEKLGFVDTGLRYEGSIFNDTAYVLIGDTQSAMVGKNVNPIYWNLIWKRVSSYMLESQVFEVHGLDRIRLTMYKMVSPIAAGLARYRNWRIKKNPRPNPKQ
ncbi:MAG: PilZ domain-containing protein [bacterium]